MEDGTTSTATVVVRENQNVTLTCKAQGFPQPKIAWKREDDADIVLSKKVRGTRVHTFVQFAFEENGYLVCKMFAGPVFSGEEIHFERISRTDIAGYLCIAANGVPPALIKRIFINVECKNENSSSYQRYTAFLVSFYFSLRLDAFAFGKLVGFVSELEKIVSETKI